MNYNELTKKIHANAINHGWWEKRLSNEHCLMLVITEISELVEADRKNDKAGFDVDLIIKDDIKKGESYNDVFESYIKNTVEDEFADIAIRLFDLAGALGIDFDKMNPCRYHRAFDKFTFTENAFALCKGLSRDVIGIEKRVLFGIEYVKKWTDSLNVDLEWHITAKMKYNENRPFMHNKKY